MRILLDEDVPEQVLHVLRHVLRRHEVDHVQAIGWKGKKDKQLFSSAARHGYDVLLTNDNRQLSDPDELHAIKKSGLHHVHYDQRTSGLAGLALAVGAIIAAMPMIATELESTDSQRLVKITSLDRHRRFKVIDPRKDPPKYWPR